MSKAIDELCQTIARLRAPGGCPWDIEQTHQSLTRCLVDEVSELLETIDCLDMPHMREELGDVLIQVIFHARIAEENHCFNFDDVVREVNEKLIRRHPHVFGNSKADNTEQVLRQWDQIKAMEKKNNQKKPGLFKSLPPRLPALMFAEAVWKQIEKKKLNSLANVPEIADELTINNKAVDLSEETLGRQLFELAAAAYRKGLDPESALRKHSSKVMTHVEKSVQESA